VQLAALRGDDPAVPVEVPAPAATTPVVVEPPDAPVAAPPETNGAAAAAAASPEYVLRSAKLDALSHRWGPEEIARIESTPVATSNGAAAPADEAPEPVSEAYAVRIQDKKKLSSRWGDEELSRIGA